MEGSSLWFLRLGGYNSQNYSYVEVFKISEIVILDGTDISTDDDSKFELFPENVRSITVGKNLTGEIGYDAYTKLNTLIMKDVQPDADATFKDRQYLATKVYVPEGSLSAYRATECWSRFCNMNGYVGNSVNPVPPTEYDIAFDGLYFNILDGDELRGVVTYREKRNGNPVPSYSGDVEIPSYISSTISI